MFQDILARLAGILKKADIPYIVIGGQAVLLYGEPRLTADIDITVGLGIDELSRLLTAAEESGLVPLVSDIEAFTKETMVVPLKDKTTDIRIDFVLSFTTYEAAAIKRAREVKIGGMEVNFASPEDVVIHKIFAGRPRDIEDLRGILLKQKDIDVGYIETSLKEFDLTFPDKRFSKTFKDLISEL